MEKEVKYAEEIKKRTRHIFYEGDKYHRRCIWHGYQIYIVGFLGINKCQIEIKHSGKQKIVDVDDAEFDLKIVGGCMK